MEQRLHMIAAYTVLALSCFSSHLLANQTKNLEPHQTNVILIFVDDMGFGDLSCYGNSDVRTPHIDRLAEEGIRLKQFYTNSPICSPSRVAVTTGNFPGRYRIHSFLSSREDNRMRLSRDWLDPSAPCIARTFQNAGYATAHFGKWHMGGGRDVGDAPLPQEYGFDHSLVAFEGLGDRLLVEGRDKASEKLGRGRISYAQQHEKTAIYVNRSIEFIKLNRNKPFYFHLWLNDLHTPYQPSKESQARVAHLDVHPFLKDFYAVLDEMDRQIGRLIATIDELGLSEQTLIILTSDNGPNLPKPSVQYPHYMSRTGPYRGEKWSLYEGGIRMPFVARMPGKIPAAATDEQTIMAAMDLFPTFCAIADIPLPEADFDGLDRSAALFGTPITRRSDAIMWEYGRQEIKFLRPTVRDNRSPNLAIRDGRWKLLVNEDGSQCELYDFSESMLEATNVAEQHPQIANRLTERVLSWYQELPSTKDRN